jgi:hypothetical protein
MNRVGIQIDEIDMRNELKQLCFNLIKTSIDLIDFNILLIKKNQHYIVTDIQSFYPGLTFKLKEHLKKETNYSTEEIDSICSKSTFNTWPESFKNDYSEKFKNVPDQAYRFKKLFFYFSDLDIKRDKCLELKGCCIHHCKRSFECDPNSNYIYQICRFGCGCCWTSYIWRLVCRPFQSKIDNPIHECLCTCLFCPCFCPYFFDKYNFEPKKIIQYGQSIFDDRPVVQIVTKQPTPFHYTKQYFHTIYNLAIEVTSKYNERFVIWLRFPFNYDTYFDIEDGVNNV